MQFRSSPMQGSGSANLKSLRDGMGTAPAEGFTQQTMHTIQVCHPSQDGHTAGGHHLAAVGRYLTVYFDAAPTRRIGRQA